MCWVWTSPSILHCLDGDLGDRHRLVAAVSLRRLGARKLSRYRFRHHLFQRYLYDHLDVVQAGTSCTRQSAAPWRRCAGKRRTISMRWPRGWPGTSRWPGSLDRAATYCLQAGRRAARLAAHEDAISHLTRGLALLEGEPDSSDVTRFKLELLLAVASPLVLARGFWSPERIRVLEQVYELAQQPGAHRQPGTRRGAGSRGELCPLVCRTRTRTLQVSEQLLGMAEHGGDPAAALDRPLSAGIRPVVAWRLGRRSQRFGRGVGARGPLSPPDFGSSFWFRYRDHQSGPTSLCALVTGTPRSGFALPTGGCQCGANARPPHHPGFDARHGWHGPFCDRPGCSGRQTPCGCSAPTKRGGFVLRTLG